MCSVAEYRLYCFDQRGKITRSHELVGAFYLVNKDGGGEFSQDDEDAIAQARAMRLEVTCELWSRERRVAKLTPDD